MADYVVLRNLSRFSTAGPFELEGLATVRARGAAGAEPPELDIAVETLDNRGVAALAADRQVVGAARKMPTKLIEPFEAGGDAAATGDAWGIAAVAADTSPRTGQGTKVAVLDTGIDRTHAAFTGMNLTEEDFTGSGKDDGQGHGTHCAGTIFGRDVNGGRIGVARGVTDAFIGKVLDDSGSGTSDMIFAGIQWAIAQGADVVSMSIGFDFPGMVEILANQEGLPLPAATSLALEAYRANLRMFDALMNMAAANEPFGKSPVVVAAAGNESERGGNPAYEIGASLPAAAEGVVSVGALEQAGGKLRIADFSNTFPQISAPGVGIKSAWIDGNTKLLNGTSMACPHVAGVAALWWELARDAGLPAAARTVTAKLLATARTDALAANTDVEDRGVGLATAPQT
jgi:subtilisin family serine protease